MKKVLNISDFVADYLTTAAWITSESGECTEFTREAKKVAKADCVKFIELVNNKFGEEKANELLTTQGRDLGYLSAHCFFLNRNGHGTGFWDREEEFGEDNAKILSQISNDMKGCDCYHIRGPKSKLTF
jgi:hypothetical protein